MHCTALSPAFSSPSPAAGHAANMAVLPESRRLSLLLMAACFLLQALSAHAITRHYKFNVRIYRHQTLPHDNCKHASQLSHTYTGCSRNGKMVYYHGFVCLFCLVQVVMRNMTRLCSTKPILTVNGKFPGPTLYAREGDNVLVKVVNHVAHNVTIHW